MRLVLDYLSTLVTVYTCGLAVVLVCAGLAWIGRKD